MKKNVLFTMVVMLMTSVSTFAQKEYNMVITLSNGTTVTLGHNDIKEITFNDGKVAISGNMVSTIDSLANAAQATQWNVNDLRSEMQEQVGYLNSQYATLTNILKDNYDDQAKSINTIWAEVQDQKMSIQSNTDAIKNVWDRDESQDAAIKQCMEKALVNQEGILANQQQMEMNKQETMELRPMIAAQQVTIAALKTEIDVLKSEIAVLKQKVEESATATAKKK